MSIPKGMKALKSSSSFVEVEIDRCCDWQGLYCSDEGWHYFRAVLQEYKENPKLKYEKSILKIYYKKYQPQTLLECLFYGEENQYEHLVTNELLELPWGIRFKSPDKNHQHYGPNSKSFGEKEINRIINVYESISTEGYQPEKYKDGYIRGFYLRRGDDYRFMITGGQHRLAALKELGYESIVVKIHVKDKRVVDRKDVKNWKNVREGMYNEELALKVFDQFFDQNGREKAEKIGVI
ncbi:hypothetical protein [Alkalibacillus haloalkaliphilus]|uniref:hypothetical protein n=1 Tax=Alkalibacillus haloalkaliphilus TaxID=94136 RepID=UPI0029359AF7|nr:hypothetical protein [Alkalibacillus haloalkaliphilus]MDV2583344.1 hypothetical protein [Alkalibacillus haloalkaliphilus]